MFRRSLARVRSRLWPIVAHSCAFMRLARRLGIWRLVRLPWLFREGLMRVFTVVDFGHFMSGTGDKASKSPALSAVTDREALLRLIQQEFVRKGVSTYPHVESPVLFFGGTKNNEREFEFFSAKAGHLGLTYSRAVNMYFLEKQVVSETQDDRSCKLLFSRLLQRFSRKLLCSPAVADMLLSYAAYFFRIFRFFLLAPERLPSLAVVANDHSSSAVAFSMVMKLFGVPRLYLQHAEVSSRFPPLDFEYSVLRNSRSEQVYKQNRRALGRIYLVARQPIPDNFERIFRPAGARVDIVIYLTAVFVPAQVRRVIELLMRNPGVARVRAKLHPRTAPELQAELEGLELLSEAPADEHIAIVGNSSMTIELLNAGIKVFQLFALDEIGADYYGFVADGLTAALSVEDLQHDFWCLCFYTEAWRQRLAGYNPALAKTPDDLHRLLTDLAADRAHLQ